MMRTMKVMHAKLAHTASNTKMLRSVLSNALPFINIHIKVNYQRLDAVVKVSSGDFSEWFVMHEDNLS